MISCNGCNSACTPFPSRDRDLSRSAENIEEPDHALIARELQALSVNERNELFDEIHGVAKVLDEDPEFVAQKLAALENELEKIKSKPAFDRAMFLSPRYVKDTEFRLKFLRADRFQPEKSAARMVSHFHYKTELFGEHKLVKDITFDDLEPEDVEEFMGGSYQFVPQKDSRGRPICLVIQKLFAYKSWQSKFRTVWYALMCAMEDEESQKTGIVNVYYNIDLGVPEPLYFELIRRIAIIDSSIPYRSISVHYCYNMAALRPALELYQMFAGTRNRVRFRTHFGSHMECQFSLMTFGITRSILQLDDNGNLKPGVMQSFYERRRALEKAREDINSGRIDYPAEMDVLLGRGRPYQNYSGNTLLSNILNVRRQEYNEASRFEKTVIAYDIVKTIHENGGRFIQRNESTDGWVEVPEAVARDKVSSGFRSKARVQESQATKRNVEFALEQVQKRNKVDRSEM
ncbi:hypothetical protein IV203_036542 [Nitzschia inconspicua]|uniref:DUF6824 domain-containing protein n=1 Tax=Nitzschia inconspicua TaxID=303405 RepID=A0A9K3LG46_9STRA|nr:hypothetical protein IV203_036542 [Nitzschia inconspicua]